MSWGSKTQIMTGAAVTGAEIFSSAVTLTPKNTIDIEVQGNSSGTTDDLIVNVYSTLDDSLESWDTVPLMSFILDCTSGGDNKISFIIKDFYKFRIGVIRKGTTDTIATDIWYRSDGVDL